MGLFFSLCISFHSCGSDLLDKSSRARNYVNAALGRNTEPCAEGKFLHFPLNTFAIIQKPSNFVFRCSLHENYTLFYREPTWLRGYVKNSEVNVFEYPLSKEDKRNGYSLNKDYFNNNFTVPTVKNMEESGYIICRVKPLVLTYEEMSVRADLVVIDDDMICTCTYNFTDDAITVLEDENIMFRCTIKYRGNIHPKMDWRVNGQQIENLTVIDESIPGRHTTTVLDVTVTWDRDQNIYQCKVYFESRDYTVNQKGDCVAPNAIPYVKYYTFPPLYVHYSPRNITMYPVKQEYAVNESIFCNAMSNTNWTAKWYKVKGSHLKWEELLNVPVDHSSLPPRLKQVSNNHQVVMSDEWASLTTITLRCIVTTTLMDKREVNNAKDFKIWVLSFQPPPTTTSPPIIPELQNSTVYAVLTILVSFIVFLVCVWYIFKYSQAKKEENERGIRYSRKKQRSSVNILEVTHSGHPSPRSCTSFECDQMESEEDVNVQRIYDATEDGNVQRIYDTTEDLEGN